MTLQEAKDQVAKKHNLTNWENACFIWAGWVKQMEPFMDEATELYARSKWDEACEAVINSIEGHPKATYIKPLFQP